MQQLLAELLQAQGFQVTTVGDAAAAVRSYEELRPDVVLMDLVLPGADGLAAARAIRELDPGAQIVVVTGLTEPTVQLQAAQMGAIAFLPKPVDWRQLLTALQTACTRRGALAPQLQGLPCPA